MSRLCWWALVGLVFGVGGRASAFSLEVRSTPSGAGVHASPADQPIAYLKGTTPCLAELGTPGTPHVLILRKAGYFAAYRYVQVDTAGLSVTLSSRDDPANWARFPAVVSLHAGFGDTGPALAVATASRTRMQRIKGVPAFVDDVDRWAPDGSAIIATGQCWGVWAEELGLSERCQDRDFSEIWWCPLSGEPEVLWRWRSEPQAYLVFRMTGDFAPDPRWLTYSAAVGDREHIRLHCTVDGSSRPVAIEDDATLYSPHFSASGRLLACIREPREDGEDGRNRSAELQVMHFNGSGRRSLAADADWQYQLAFSPDERHIAYVNVGGQLAVVRVAGGEPRALIGDVHWAAAGDPLWSPDGRRVAVCCKAVSSRDRGRIERDRDTFRTCWADLNSEAGGFVRACEPLAWQDDQHLAARIREYAVEPGIGYERLATVGLDGRVLKILWQPAVLFHGTRPSPDGKLVAALGWRRDGPTDVFVCDPETHELWNLTASESLDFWELGWVSHDEVWAVAGPEASPVHSVIEVRTGALQRVAERPAVLEHPREGDPGYSPGWHLTGRNWLPHLAPTIPEGW